MKNERVGKQGKTKLMCEITATEKRQRENSATKIEMVGKKGNCPFFRLPFFRCLFRFRYFRVQTIILCCPFFPPSQIFVAEFSPCPIFRLPFFSVARFSVNLSNMYRMF